MDSSGVCWKAPYYIVEDDFTVPLVNAQHIKHVPGRKTDVIDAAWIAQLLAHGLLRGSLVPPSPIREVVRKHPNFAREEIAQQRDRIPVLPTAPG